MYERNRNLVRRGDGRLVNVARPRGHLFVCHNNCCCGRTEDGFAPVPVDVYHDEWERRRLRNVVHLTVGGCLGPCALANVAMLLFDGQTLWFQSMNSAALVYALYEYVEDLLDAGRVLEPPPFLAERRFTAAQWQPRPDGQPVEDYRPRRPRRPSPPRDACAALHEARDTAAPEPAATERVVADMDGAVALPRKNGELVFDAPWEGRAFGMAVALNEQQLYRWDDFRTRLIDKIGSADADSDPSGYYERWLAAFESLLTDTGLVSKEELDERTYEFEFGERDDVF